MPDQLIVQPVEIIQPLVLASPGFLQTLAKVEQDIASLQITDAATAQQAADLQSRLTAAAKTLDTQRKALNKPFDDQIAAINAAAKQPAQRIELAKQSVSKALTAFAVEQQRLQREAEMKRQAELKALQEQAAKEKAEADRLSAEAKAAVTTDASEEDWGAPAPVVVAPTETEKKIAAIAVPAVRVTAPAGVAMRVTLEAIVEDIEKIPPMFIERTVKLRAIVSTYCVKWSENQPLPVCPGIKFEIKRSTVSTGR